MENSAHVTVSRVLEACTTFEPKEEGNLIQRLRDRHSKDDVKELDRELEKLNQLNEHNAATKQAHEAIKIQKSGEPIAVLLHSIQS